MKARTRAIRNLQSKRSGGSPPVSEKAPRRAGLFHYQQLVVPVRALGVVAYPHPLDMRFFGLRLAATALAAVLPQASHGQFASQQAMHQQVIAVYDFHPHAVSNSVRAQKSSEMDTFWSEVKEHKDADLPLLRAELARPDAPPFFRMDGAQLLLSLSSRPSDQAIAVSVMSTADLSDVTPAAYFYAVHHLSMQGADTTAAALHILDDPSFVVYIPQHAMTLHASDCLLFLLLPVDPSKWLAAVRQKLPGSSNSDVAQALVTLIFYAQTPESDAALHSIAANTALPDSVRKIARNWEQAASEAYKHKVDVPGDEAQVREARRQRLNAVSDESIDDVQEMTMRLVQLRHHQAS